MSLIHPLDHSGWHLLEGYQGETKISGTDDGKPWESYIVQTVPISGTNGGALYVFSTPPTGSISGSSGYVVYGSGSDGLPHAIGATQNSNGTWSIQTDTELILSGNVVINNVRVYSTDGTSSSLVYGRAKSDGTIYATPDYSRATHSIDLVDTDVGLTSSDYTIYEYKYFCIQFSNMLNCTASISGTMDALAADPTYWIPITTDISGYHAITGSCIICQDTPVKWEKIRVNFSKSITPSNSIDLWVSLYN
jgi:hypothetical protein